MIKNKREGNDLSREEKITAFFDKYKLKIEKDNFKSIDNHRKQGNNIFIKDRDGNWKLHTSMSDFLTYEGEYQNGIKNGKGKEYKLISINLISNSKRNDKIIEKSKINLIKELQKSEFFENIRFKSENQVGIININKEEFIYYRKLEYVGEFNNGKRWNGKGKENNSFLFFEGEYLNGKFWNGIIKLFNSKGNISFEGEYSQGKRKGKEYDNDINYILEGEYLDKKINGKRIEYDYKGKKIFEGEFLKGKKNGKGIEYDDKGNIIFEGEYSNDKKWNGKEYNYKGNKHFEQGYINGVKKEKIIIKEYFKDKLIFEGEYKDGKKNGKGIEYFKNKLIYEGEYKDGKRNGKGIEYNFEGGKFVGEFKDGKKWDGTGYNGKTEIDYEIINGYGIVKEYYDGKLIFEGEYINGKREGYGKEYDFLTGNLKHRGIFCSDKKIMFQW